MVYITSGLFGHDHAHEHPSVSTSTHTHMRNNMADSQSTTGLGKRKRRIEGDTEGPILKQERTCDFCPSFGDDIHSLGNHNSSYLRSSPNEAMLRLHGHNLASHQGNGYWSHSKLSSFSNFERRPVKQIRRLNSKISLVKTPSHLMDIELDLMPSSPPVQRTDAHANSDLRPCHACSTAPKRKRDLENYMDCRRCEGRTCYICARECSGCQKAICKKCIVEVGREGEPWCLECYSRHINT